MTSGMFTPRPQGTYKSRNALRAADREGFVMI